MKKLLKSLGISLVVIMFTCVFGLPSNAIKYTDGRFIKNTKVQQWVKKAVTQHRRYDDKYGICCKRIGFSFGVNKKTNMTRNIEITAPMPYGHSVRTFFISFHPKSSLSSLELVNIFLNSDDFNEQDYTFDIDNITVTEEWCPDNENEYDNPYSIMTDITEDNWREKFSDEESVIPDLCPRSLMFFELHPGEKFFVKGYEH